jgi:hypothetical protein
MPVVELEKATVRGAAPELGDALNDTTGGGPEGDGVGEGGGDVVSTGASNRTSLE